MDRLRGYLKSLIDSENSKKIILRNLLDRYVGQFLLEKLSVTQFTIDILAGVGNIQNLYLDVKVLNEIAEQLNLPLKFIDGFIGEISVKIPWNYLFAGNCRVDITGLSLTLHPKHRQEDVSLVDSMIDSMSTSMQIAQQCFSQVEVNNTHEAELNNISANDIYVNPGIDSLELFAEAIDTILKRVQVRFIDTSIRLQYEPNINSEVGTGIAIDLHIDIIDYFDEAGMDEESRERDKNEKNIDELAAKKFVIQGINIYTDEFSNNIDVGNCNVTTEKAEELFYSKTMDKDINTSIDLPNCHYIGLTDNEESFHSEPILILKICGHQEIKLRIREIHEIVGPKVQVEAKLGFCIGFFTPRQIHLLLEFFEAYSSPEKTQLDNKQIPNGRTQKPMNQNDYNKIENQLQRNLQQGLILDKYSNEALNTRETWSVPTLDDNHENYHPMDIGIGQPFSRSAPMTTSQISDYSEFGGSIFSSASSQVNIKAGLRQCDNKVYDSKNEINLSIKVAFRSISFLILHENLLVSSDREGGTVTDSSLADMITKSKDFFGCFENLGHFENNEKEFNGLKQKFETSCLLSHIRLIASPFIFEIIDKTIGRKWERSSDMTLGYIDIVENIYDSITKKQISSCLLSFSDKHIASELETLSSDKSSIRINIKETCLMSKISNFKSTNIPKTEVFILLDSCIVELDISIVDRLHTLLNKEAILKNVHKKTTTSDGNLDNRIYFDQMFEDESILDKKFNIQIKIPLLSMKVYFPIPDLRPLSDIHRVSWWEKNVRKETIHVNFESFLFNASLDSQLSYDNYEVKCNDMHVLFQLNEKCSPISLVRASIPNDSDIGFDLIRIVLQVYPLQSKNDLGNIIQNENLMNKSMMGFLEDISNKEPCIFSKRRMISYQKDELNELTLPSSKEEINRFIEDTLESVQYKLDINLPQVQFVFPSKHILEILYNRLISDLLLWAPSAPMYQPSRVFETGTNKSVNNDLTFRQFKFCQNYKNINSTEDETYSMPIPDIDAGLDDETICPKQTYLTLMLCIGDLVGYIYTPSRDVCDKIIQNKHGEFILSASTCSIFVASGFKGEMDTCINSITANKVSLSHDATVEKDISPIYLKSYSSQDHEKRNMILYPSDSVMKMEGQPDFIHNYDCLVLSIRTEFDALKNEKKLQFAGGLNNITLNHIVTTPNESWVSQLKDMFTLEDYPIAGYSLPSVLTELNFQLKYFSVFYEPLNLPIKSVLMFDSVFISSNMNLEGDYSLILIIIEDAGIFLSQDASSTINLKENYTCIAHLGLLEVCINYGIKFELSVSNDMLHIRTCSDSFKALLELLIYINKEGDLLQISNRNEESETQSYNKSINTNPQYTSTYAQAHALPTFNLIKNNIDHSIVEAMMQDAMMDSSPCTSDKGQSTNCNEIKDVINEFYFPDESEKNKPKPYYTEEDSDVLVESFVEDTISSLREALQDSDDAIRKSDNEFCMLHNIPGTGIRSVSGNPQARCFWHDDKIYSSMKVLYYEVLEDPHLNFLKNENKSSASTKFVMHDVSLTWHIYGGNDFLASKCETYKIPPTKMDVKSRSYLRNINKLNVVSFSDGEACIVSESQSVGTPQSSEILYKNSNLKWYIQGGINRNHDVLLEFYINKIKFLQENFSGKSKLQSQCILNIFDFEIRDKLVSSKINKFLYQYYTEACPRQAKSNMVTVVATTMKSDPQSLSPETALTVSLRPLRLHIDQDSLIFLGKFLNEISSIDINSEKDNDNILYGKNSYIPAPVINVNSKNISFSSNGDEIMSELNEDTGTNSKCELSQPIFFNSFVFSPDVPIKIDYHGKHVDINSEYGALAGLIIGLGQLDNSEITLKRIEILNGTLGMNKLIGAISDEWINDIRRHQLPSILGGVGPLHSFVQLASGIRDLLWLPIEQYQKDGRLLRGIQKGTSSFTSSSAYAALDLSEKFVGCIQSIAETMYDMVSAGPSVRHKSYRRKNVQPQDIREGVVSAVGLMKNGLGDTATTIWKVASEEHFHKGMSGAVGGLLRQIPPSVVQPIILASEATCTVIGGFKNQLVPDARKEATEKWKV